MTIEHCRIVKLPKITDPRGNLTYIEGGEHIPFDIQRVYYLYDVPGGSERGGHAHKNLQQLIVAMSKGRFDRIIIDSAPLQAVSDALVLASYADSVIFVVKADSTPATQAKKCIASVLGSNEPLTGVVLNQFDVRKAASYYGDGYYQYGDYDQSDEPEKTA